VKGNKELFEVKDFIKFLQGKSENINPKHFDRVTKILVDFAISKMNKKASSSLSAAHSYLNKKCSNLAGSLVVKGLSSLEDHHQK